MRGVYKKELNHFFHTMLAYVFIAMFLLITGMLFVMINLSAQNGDIKSFFTSLTTVMIFLIPIITMGLFSTEKSEHTDELLMTSPVSMVSVACGKFFAALTLFCIPLAITIIYPVILLSYGISAVYETIGCYVGTVLLSGACISIGLFISALTDSQFIAAILTYSVFAILQLLGTFYSAVSGSLLQNVLYFFAITEHSSSLSYAVLNIGDLIYYISIICLFLYLSIYTQERVRVA